MTFKGNPLTIEDHQEDDQLIKKILGGDRKALNQLLEVHNLFIYNIAIKMIGNVEEAKDLTQDILVKITANLAKYQPEKGKFRSWLYRLAFNHILDYKKTDQEQSISSFESFFERIGEIEDQPLDKEDESLTNELKIKCMNGMLLCLSREQRLLYIIGDLFQIDHTIGAEIFNVSKENFRKKLSRTRKELTEWMHNRCGLVNKDNPCRCAKKTKGFIEKGIVDPENLIWKKDIQGKIEDYSAAKIEELTISSDQIYQRLYHQHPMKVPKTADEVISTVLGDKNMQEILEI